MKIHPNPPALAAEARFLSCLNAVLAVRTRARGAGAAASVGVAAVSIGDGL